MAYLTNEDFGGFTGLRSEARMTAEELTEQMVFYAGNGGNTTILNLNAQKAFFDSKVMECSWNGLDFRDDGSVYYRGKKLADGLINTFQMAKNTKILFDNVEDPTALRIAAGRAHGSKVFLSMRMNDVHQVDNPNSVLVTDFWREHPEYRTMPYTPCSFWFGHTFNYAVPEVYDRMLALAREMLTRFLPDGLELDWMRSPYYFEPGTEFENAHILTDFTRAVRQIADECEKTAGHEIEIIARVPTRPQEALRMGFDVAAWCREKLVTRVIPSSYFSTVDADVPLELWRALLGSEIKITPGLESYLQEKPGTPYIYTLPEIDFGFAATFYYRGADDIYLFNHMEHELPDFPPWRENMRFIQSIIGDREKVERQRRRHLVTYSDYLTHPVGTVADGILPLDTGKDPGFLRINVGGATSGRRARVILSCKNEFASSVLCNGKPCISDGKKIEVNPPGEHEMMEALRMQYADDIKFVMIWEIPAGVLKDGDNVLFFKEKCVVTWCEIDIDAAK